MARRQRRGQGKRAKAGMGLATIQANAAGIDLGATAVYAAVPADRDAESVRHFGTFTADLRALAEWLRACGITTVAMESTGVYWIPVFQILEQQGLEVCLVNARHLKNVPGRKSDVQDCQWIQYLHAVGLLRGSFRPKEEVCALRTLLRHREELVHHASAHVQHMHKALTQMNVQIHHVISDLTGQTGLRILDAILEGERDPQQLAQLRDWRIKASVETIVKSLEGDWRVEHLFTLRQALATFRHYQRLIHECDAEIERQLQQRDSQVDPVTAPLSAPKKKQRQSAALAPRFAGDLRTELYRVLGVDLTAVPGLNTQTISTVYAELGADLSAFPSGKHFSSWMGICPDNRVSGGKVLSVQTRPVTNRVAHALRLAAQSLHHSDTALGAYYRRMRARLGAPKAITATAHKLARITYHLITTRLPYDESVFIKNEQRHQQRRASRLQREAAALGYHLVAAQ